MGLFGRFKAPKATISVMLEKDSYSLKEPLTGTVNVSSSEKFDADEVRLEIWVNEWTKATEKQGTREKPITVTAQQNSVLHQSKNSIGGQMQFTDGFSDSIDFSIHLPSGVPPTYRSQNARNTWMMKGVIAVKGRPDVTSHDMEVVITY